MERANGNPSMTTTNHHGLLWLPRPTPNGLGKLFRRRDPKLTALQAGRFSGMHPHHERHAQG